MTRYRVIRIGSSVNIHRWEQENGCFVWCGNGTWNGEWINDCTAELGEPVYMALDDALMDLDGDGTVEVEV